MIPRINSSANPFTWVRRVFGARSARCCDRGAAPARGASPLRAAYVVALLFVFLLGAGLPRVVRAAGKPVGQVLLAIGVSHLIDAQGHRIAVARGMSVHVGERVQTGRGGHVHLRFIDGAFVAVRPNSLLVIQAYHYDPAHPQKDAIRFTLEHGVARSISGKAAHAAHDRFRLNTPIAAIGVRGTDFVVLAQPDRVLVAINSGAITLTPFGDGCLVMALGPCSTAATRTLSADMGKVMLDFQRRLGAPRLIPINGALPEGLSPPGPGEPPSIARANKFSNDANNEVLAVQAVADAHDQAVSEQPSPSPEPSPPPTPTPPPPAPTPLPPATLVWGRWGAAFPGDTMSEPYAEAKVGRKVTAGDMYFALFRPEPALPILVSNLGRVDFTLRDAQVWLLQGGLAQLGSVDNAWLSVDFGARQFATGIDMSQASVGSSSLQLGGAIRDDGVFAVRTADGNVVAGALTVDGKEAGYFFEHPVTAGAGGTFVGITRWVH